MQGISKYCNGFVAQTRRESMLFHGGSRQGPRDIYTCDGPGQLNSEILSQALTSSANAL